MRFVKMHGLGNDYVYVDGFTQNIENPSALSMAVADRHFGIGSDGLILALPAEGGVDAHFRMRMFNVDGSEGQMCGNGIRCLCKFAHDHELFPGARAANPVRIQTGNGVLTLDFTLDPEGLVQTVTVDMGTPKLKPAEVPVDVSKVEPTDQPQTFTFTLPDGRRVDATCVCTGNPHAVIYVDDLQPIRDALTTLGPAWENHEAFPERANIHFTKVISAERVEVVHWERGSGATMACGTGASAVCVAGVVTGRTGRNLTATLPGGDLFLSWPKDDGSVFMTGPATEAYTGVWPE